MLPHRKKTRGRTAVSTLRLTNLGATPNAEKTIPAHRTATAPRSKPNTFIASSAPLISASAGLGLCPYYLLPRYFISPLTPHKFCYRIVWRSVSPTTGCAIRTRASLTPVSPSTLQTFRKIPRQNLYGVLDFVPDRLRSWTKSEKRTSGQ